MALSSFSFSPYYIKLTPAFCLTHYWHGGNLGDNAALKQALFNRSFVLMQYFGYLRRDPEQ
ncbi:MAG TPA: hypothetical protein VF982_03950, partial [Anaerolineales bacterium]